MADRRRAGNRKGGQNKANAVRVARQWAAIGRELPDEDLPAVVKALIFSVREGAVDPGVANCIAGLAKVAVQLHGDLDVERRLQALEEAAAANRPTTMRRMA
jgi:hypothetical protein